MLRRFRCEVRRIVVTDADAKSRTGARSPTSAAPSPEHSTMNIPRSASIHHVPLPEGRGIRSAREAGAEPRTLRSTFNELHGPPEWKLSQELIASRSYACIARGAIVPVSVRGDQPFVEFEGDGPGPSA